MKLPIFIISFLLFSLIQPIYTHDITVPTNVHFGLPAYGTYISFASQQTFGTIYRENNYWYFNDYGLSVENANMTVNKYFESDELEFTVSAPTGTTSTTKVYCGSKGKPKRVDGATSWSYDNDTKICTITVTHSGMKKITVIWTATHNGLTLTKEEHTTGSGSGYIYTVTSPNKYNLSLAGGFGTYKSAPVDWNLTRLDCTPTEMVFKKINWWMGMNGTVSWTGIGPSSGWYGSQKTVTNETFDDSLGSGIKLNFTFPSEYTGAVSIQQIFWCYPDFIVEQLIAVNDYDNNVRRITTPKFVSWGGYKNFKVGEGSTTRISGIWSNGYDKPASTTGTCQFPVFAYNTAEDKGVVLGFLDLNWDWLFYVQYYNGAEDPSIGMTTDAYSADYQTEYITLNYGTRYNIGKLFIELTGKQMDDAFQNYGTAIKTLYEGRGELTGFTPVWTSWSEFSIDRLNYDNVTAVVDYLYEHPEFDVKTIQLDDGWQQDYGNWTETYSGFGANLSSTIDYIKNKGFKVGVWIAPWRVSSSWVLNNATMKSWLLNRTSDGNYKQEPLNDRYPISYFLNPTITDARAWILNQLNTLVSMGVSYFKLDYCGVRDVTQMENSNYTRTTWQEKAFDIVPSLDKNTVYISSAMPVWRLGWKLPYYAQKYTNSFRYGIDLTNGNWDYTKQSYADFHNLAVYKYLTAKPNVDMMPSHKFWDGPYASHTDAEYHFHLVYRGLSKHLELGEAFEDSDSLNDTKLTWQRNFIPFYQANWTQRDYWQNNGVTRTWLTDPITFLGSTYYYLAVLNPTASSDSWTIDFTDNLALPSGTYMMYDQFAESYIGEKTQTQNLTISLEEKDAKIYVLLKTGGANPTILTSTTCDHIISNKLGSPAWITNELNFTVTAKSGTTSTTKVYCGNKGEPIAIITNGTLTWTYDASTMTLTLNVTHQSHTRIVVYWKLPGDIDSDGDVDPADFYLFAGAYGTSPPSDPRCDLDNDGDVDSADFYIFAGNYGKRI